MGELSIKFGNYLINYILKRSKKRKTLSISVDQTGVTVIAPLGILQGKIESTLKKKAPWIINQLKSYEEMNLKFQPKSFFSGEKLPYLGRHYRLKVIKSSEHKQPTFQFYQGLFLAKLPLEIPLEKHRGVIYPLYLEWLKHRALEVSQNRLKRFTLILQQQPGRVVIKEQEQRWGSCSTVGDIYLNWRIFLAPTSIIDYVLAHELVHLKHMNHSKEYWETLRMILPDYEQRKEWLRLNGKTLDI